MENKSNIAYTKDDLRKYYLGDLKDILKNHEKNRQCLENGSGQEKNYFVPCPSTSSYDMMCKLQKCHSLDSHSQDTLDLIANAVFGNESITEDQIQFVTDACNTCNFETLFWSLVSHFEQIYSSKKNELKFLSRYSRVMDIHAENLDVPYVYVDELVGSALFGSLSTMCFWSEYQQDEVAWNFCYSHLRHVLYQQGCRGILPKEEVIALWKNLVKTDPHLLQIASDTFWVSIAFAIAHELAHIYLNHQADYTDKEKTYSQEFEADAVAYDLVLNKIMYQKSHGVTSDWDVYHEYTYLAPLVFLEFFNLITYTEFGVENNDTASNYPSIQLRMDKLLEMVKDPVYQFDTEEGNDLCNCYLDIADYYKERLQSQITEWKEMRKS
ncbi:ImmA/IrrE family metallo-endopeptidase [Methanocorpusculum sp. MG]|uniref:ImmA/IrrE family metallo-endopeptidase n=1 Tax=Methanocorpusculum petauri TaxID=3002863 RepID=A0ABT4IDZ7_9EURY|nr:ImmA/IrrE family metallo-endopeptidase [Methanocorpusculum petauri]MCZ0859961.1 ImmA/IrrE family metallo-endopeptidase [Methanocorpusculum petauri]